MTSISLNSRVIVHGWQVFPFSHFRYLKQESWEQIIAYLTHFGMSRRQHGHCYKYQKPSLTKVYIVHLKEIISRASTCRRGRIVQYGLFTKTHQHQKCARPTKQALPRGYQETPTAEQKHISTKHSIKATQICPVQHTLTFHSIISRILLCLFVTLRDFGP